MLLSLYSNRYYKGPPDPEQTARIDRFRGKNMKTRRPLQPFAFLLAALLPLTGWAEVYTWKDENGKVHYSSRPPAGPQGETRKLAAPPPVDTEPVAKANAEKQMNEREKQQKSREETTKPTEDPAAARVREEGCRNAKANLAGIESGQMRYALDARGERVALDGAARDAELAKARKNVTAWCSSSKQAAK